VILDEPTTVLSPGEVENLFNIIRSLQLRATFVFISHHLDEIIKYTNRVIILKDGENVGEEITAETNIKTLQELMVGREFSTDFYFAKELRIPEKKIVLKAEDLISNTIKNVNFTMYKGEILGIAGLMGCGKEELAKVIFGDSSVWSGTVSLENGMHLQNKVSAAVEAGIGYLPSDRRSEGILSSLSVTANTTIANLNNYLKLGIYINKYKERQAVDDFIFKLKIKTPSGKTKMMNLSGGNQQKVILARWLCRKPSILLMEQPTRGIDVGAKQEIYRLMRELVNQGISILVMSDEMPELIGLCNRIIMMKNGRITGELNCQKEEKPNEQQIIQYIT
jgi:ribose transport system ATP-binding protein